MTDALIALVETRQDGNPRGMASICSAHPRVLETTLGRARRTGRPVLIEATCNQVNQDGGYTGMTPADFGTMVRELAEAAGLAPERLLLGGDHMGPNPWRKLASEAALDKAQAMVAAYARAGFGKIHLDASMGC